MSIDCSILSNAALLKLGSPWMPLLRIPHHYCGSNNCAFFGKVCLFRDFFLSILYRNGMLLTACIEPLLYSVCFFPPRLVLPVRSNKEASWEKHCFPFSRTCHLWRKCYWPIKTLSNSFFFFFNANRKYEISMKSDFLNLCKCGE